MAEATTDPGLSLNYRCSVDGLSMGTVIGIQGMGIDQEVEERPEGGSHGIVHKFAKRLSYPNVTITRAINEDTPNIIKHFTEMADKDQKSTVVIEALAPNHSDVIAKWTLMESLLVSYRGPSFSSGSPATAVETLVISVGMLT